MRTETLRLGQNGSIGDPDQCGRVGWSQADRSGFENEWDEKIIGQDF